MKRRTAHLVTLVMRARGEDDDGKGITVRFVVLEGNPGAAITMAEQEVVRRAAQRRHGPRPMDVTFAKIVRLEALEPEPILGG